MPDWKEEIRSRLASLNLDPSREAAIVEELCQHASDRYEELMQQGISAEDAALRTVAELSDARLPDGVMQVASTPRSIIYRKLPFATRILVKYWKLTAVAVLSLGIAMAASVAGLSVFNALLLRPPVAAAPSRLLTLHETSPAGDIQNVSLPEYKYYRDNNRVFSGLAGFEYGINWTDFTESNEKGMAVISTVTENYFDVLGVHPAVGRFFSGADSVVTQQVVLSYPFWQRLGQDPGITGKTIKLGKNSVAVLGVAPKGFIGTVAGFSIDIWAPAMQQYGAESLNHMDNRWLTLIGRLKPGINQSQAQADMSTLAQQLAHDFPASNKGYMAKLTPLTMLPIDGLELARMFSWTVMGVVLLVLLAACSNVINLLLGLAAARRQEMLIRAALGATRGRLVRQLISEIAVICVVSSLIGFSLASYGLQRLLAFRPVIFSGLPPLVLDLRPDLRVAALTIAVILIVTAVMGLVPALHSSMPNLAGALNGEIAVGGTRKRRARSVLVVIQTAVCTLVLVGAGLCFRSIEYLKRVPLGFSARNLVFTVVGGGDGDSQEQRLQFYAAVRRESAALPGVRGISLSTSVPLGQNGSSENVVPEGMEASSEQWSAASYNLVDDNYFSVLGLPLMNGRSFDASETEHSPEAAVINLTLAKKYWPQDDPVGKRLRVQRGNRIVEIVGVVGDSKYGGLDETQIPYLYLALRQHPTEAINLYLNASTSGEPRRWIEPIMNRVRKTYPNAVFILTGTLEDQINFSLLIPRIIFACVSGFGLLALVLSMAGIYATTSYSVSERKKEIGIRLALGAQPKNVMAALLRQSALTTGVGLALGIGLGILMSSLLHSLLYGIRPVETGVLIAVLLLTSSIGLLTAYWAARPWVRVDPLEAVRHV
jgi:putative ABC transport system permease protein